MNRKELIILETYDSVIIGGGIAGMQASIQLGRCGHSTLVADAGYGRSVLCRKYSNVLGWPDGISGARLRELGRLQAERLGVIFRTDEIIEAKKDEDGLFTVHGRGELGKGVRARTLLLATGVGDRLPNVPGLEDGLGRSVFICPDCDGYEVRGLRTVVLGAGESGANMALTLLYWTKELIYINHERKPIQEETKKKLKASRIELIEEIAERVVMDERAAADASKLRGIRLTDGRLIEAERGFLAFGGNSVRTELAAQLGAERMENKHIVTDPRTKLTSVKGLWAAGDIAVHSEQLAIAMAEGAQAAIWMHKALLSTGAEFRDLPKQNGGL